MLKSGRYFFLLSSYMFKSCWRWRMPLGPYVSCWCREAIIREPANPRFGRSLRGFPWRGRGWGGSDGWVYSKSLPELKSNKFNVLLFIFPGTPASESATGANLPKSCRPLKRNCHSGSPTHLGCLWSWRHVNFLATCQRERARLHLQVLMDISVQGFAWPAERGEACGGARWRTAVPPVSPMWLSYPPMPDLRQRPAPSSPVGWARHADGRHALQHQPTHSWHVTWNSNSYWIGGMTTTGWKIPAEA